MGAWSIIPLADAVPQLVIGPKLTRILLVLTVLLKGYALVWCKVNAARCHNFFQDFSWQREIGYSGQGTFNTMQPTLLFEWLVGSSDESNLSIVHENPRN